MPEFTLLTDAQREIMKGIWSLLPHNARLGVTVRDVHAHLYPHGEKALTTVQTIMDVLCAKSFLKKELIGKVNFFTAAVSKDEAISRETAAYVSRVFDGSIDDLVAHFVGHETLTPQHLARLKDRLHTLIERARST